jgi:hypothetical protein
MGFFDLFRKKKETPAPKTAPAEAAPQAPVAKPEVVAANDGESGSFELAYPVWRTNLEDPTWLDATAKNDEQVVLTTFADLSQADNTVISTAETGLLAGAIPLYLMEALQLRSAKNASASFAFLQGHGAVTAAHKLSQDDMKKLSEAKQTAAVITGSINAADSKFTITVSVYHKDSDTTDELTLDAGKDDFGASFLAFADKVLQTISADFPVDQTKYYQPPTEKACLDYLIGLAQGLLLSLEADGIVKAAKIPEADIFTNYERLASTYPENDIVKLLITSGAAKSKAAGSEVYMEYRKRLRPFLRDPKASHTTRRILPLAYIIYGKRDMMTTLAAGLKCKEKDPRYVSWLEKIEKIKN